jgi:hypothetical protein
MGGKLTLQDLSDFPQFKDGGGLASRSKGK